MAKNNKDKNKKKGGGGGGVKAALKKAGSDGSISKKELKKISKKTSTTLNKVIQQLDKVNQSLKAKDKQGVALNSGAANLVIKQAEKKPASLLGGFGSGKIGKALSSMIGSPSTMIKGQSVGGKEGTGLMMGGTQIRSGGRTAVRRQGQGGGVSSAGTAVDTGFDTGSSASDTGFEDGFDFQAYLDSLMGAGDDLAMPEMPQLESFDQLSSEFDTPNALSFASLGQSYLSDAIRAARRKQQSRRDYLRNNMAQMAAPLSAMLSIGGGLGGLM